MEKTEMQMRRTLERALPKMTELDKQKMLYFLEGMAAILDIKEQKGA